MKKIKDKGFSLIEIMLAGSIGAGILLGIIQYFVHINKDITKAQSIILDTIDGLNFEMAINATINETKYSFNTLLVKDDNNLLFFDYMPEGKCLLSCSRISTLTKGSTQGSLSKEIYLIVKDNSNSVEQIFHPKDAYLHPKFRSDDDSNLVFRSLNQDGFLEVKTYTPWVLNVVGQEQLILIYSPYMVYKSGLQLGSGTGKMIQFMGWIKNSNMRGSLIREQISVAGATLFNDADPRYNDLITSEDKMLRRIPFLAGTAAFTMIAAVKVVRLRIETQIVNGKLIGVLFKDTLTSGNKYTKAVMASGVDQVIFTRKSISGAEINVEIKYSK